MIRFAFFCLGTFLWVIFLNACGSGESSESKGLDETEMIEQDSAVLVEEQVPVNNCDSLADFQTITVFGHEVDIALPPDSVEIKGNLMILQGWNFPKEDWCNRASLCKKALSQGYRLIMPEMGRSTYSTRLYPETLSQWRKYPTRRWLTDTLVRHLQDTFCVMLPEQKNFVIGLSTGARGAALVSLNLPDLITAMAALSGDFDQRLIPQERIMNGFYGSPAQFPERWAGEDNLVTQIQRFRTPSYLGHGVKDYVCPPSQTRLFYDSLKNRYPDLELTLSMPNWAGHDYTYWDYETDRVLDFFGGFWGND